jgi:putative FmdB family regulatory protein
MPTYDYQCKECGHTFEEFQSMSSDLLIVCPSCGKPALKRLMASGVGMIFKGSGFYQTDYKNTNSSVSTSSTSSTDGAKQETKPSPSAKTDSSPSDSKTDSSQSGSKPDSSQSGSKPDSSK